MNIEELKDILVNEESIFGDFTEIDIDYFSKNDKVDYVEVNKMIVPYHRICIGTQILTDKLEDTSLLFVYDFKQCQIKIKDINSLVFNPEKINY